MYSGSNGTWIQSMFRINLQNLSKTSRCSQLWIRQNLCRTLYFSLLLSVSFFVLFYIWRRFLCSLFTNGNNISASDNKAKWDGEHEPKVVWMLGSTPQFEETDYSSLGRRRTQSYMEKFMRRIIYIMYTREFIISSMYFFHRVPTN